MAIKIIPTDVPNKKATAAEWKTWHEALKGNFGKKTANYIFTRAWNKRGGVNSPANTADLRSYLSDNGIELDKSWSASIVDAGGGILDVFGDIFAIQKYVGIAIAVVVIGGAGMLIYNVAKDPIRAAGAAAKLKGGM